MTMTTVSDDELIARLDAVDEAAMYDAPATTEATIRQAAARLRELSTARRADAERIAELEKALSSCCWYWPEDDTSSESCADSAQEVVEVAYGWETPSGEIVAVARGGVVEVTYCACLPPADDSDSDDEFWVEEATEDAALTRIEAEKARRASLTRKEKTDGK